MKVSFFRQLCCAGLWACFAVDSRAQEIVRNDTIAFSASGSGMTTEPLSDARPVLIEEKGLEPPQQAELPDTMSWKPRQWLPALASDSTVAYFPVGYCGGYMGLWDLHEGFNASLNMSVSASFGRNRFPGVGFGTGISAMYVHSLTNRLIMGVGGFYDRMSWNGFNENRLGINLMLGYQLTERLGLYAYGSKAFNPSRDRRMWFAPMPWMNDYKSRLGAMLHFKVSEAVSFSVSVEKDRY